VINSTSPPAQNYADRSDASAAAKGKRKASPSDAAIANLIATNNAIASKRRKKEEMAPALPSSKAKGADQSGTPRTAYPPEYQAPKNAPLYRGAYDSNLSYQSPNGTRWTDTIDVSRNDKTAEEQGVRMIVE
jgi:hypothetical protein